MQVFITLNDYAHDFNYYLHTPASKPALCLRGDTATAFSSPLTSRLSNTPSLRAKKQVPTHKLGTFLYSEDHPMLQYHNHERLYRPL